MVMMKIHTHSSYQYMKMSYKHLSIMQLNITYHIKNEINIASQTRT